MVLKSPSGGFRGLLLDEVMYHIAIYAVSTTQKVEEMRKDDKRHRILQESPSTEDNLRTCTGNRKVKKRRWSKQNF